MTADDRSTAAAVHNELSGSTGASVQAGTVAGGVHITVGGEPVGTVPRQLPPDVVAFVNRARELADLDALLSRSSLRNRPTSVVISTIAGAAGVGKTALAVHWAHRARGAFPDGDLFVDLRGYDLRARLTPDQALSGLLHALEVPSARMPTDLDGRAALFRSLLASRSVLLILDNAAGADQVRHLLPGTGRCLVLVTSRSRLSGLAARDGAARVTVGHLSKAESLRLLGEVVGVRRVDEEAEAARRLTVFCDRLPLALRIVAERAVTHPHHTLGDLADELSDERDRLDRLTLDEDEKSAVRSVFSWSYKALSPALARTFRLLGVHPSAVFTTASVAALTGERRPVAATALDRLSGLHLIEQAGRDRFRIHDLLRSYALEKVMEEEPEERRDEAADRALVWYLHTAHAASRLILPQGREMRLPTAPAPAAAVVAAGAVDSPGTLPDTSFDSLESALQWCEEERLTLLDAVRLAHTTGRHEIAWKLPVALMGFFERRSYWEDWISTHNTGLQSARSAGDRFGEGWVSLSLADAYWDIRRIDEAMECFEHALDASREIGDRWGEGFSLRGLGLAHLELRHFQQAVDYSRQAQPVFAEIGERRGEGMCHLSVGQGLQGLGRVTEALACYDQALAVFRELGNDWSTALATFRRATALRLRGEATGSADAHRSAADAFHRLGDRRHEALVLTSLGDLYAATGAPARAVHAWRAAHPLLEDLGDPQAHDVLTKITAATAPEAEPP